MFDFLKKKHRSESKIEVTNMGITITVDGEQCLKDISIQDAMRIFYALHFIFVKRYTFKTKKSENHGFTDDPSIRSEVELDPRKIDCREFGDEIDVRYDGRLIYSGPESKASTIYYTLRQFIGEESAEKIIADPTGDYTIVLGQ